MRNHDIERHIRDAGDRASEQVRGFAGDAAGRARNLYDRGRKLGERFSSRGSQYSQRLSNAAEDLADEANYRYRRLRRQVSRHPAAAVAIVAGTIGAFLLLRRAFRSDDDE